MLFNRDEQATAEELKHTSLATARLRFLFLAAKNVRHAGAVLARSSDHYAEQGILMRLMNRLRSIMPGDCFIPLVPTPFRLLIEPVRIEFMPGLARNDIEGDIKTSGMFRTE